VLGLGSSHGCPTVAAPRRHLTGFPWFSAALFDRAVRYHTPQTPGDAKGTCRTPNCSSLGLVGKRQRRAPGERRHSPGAPLLAYRGIGSHAPE